METMIKDRFFAAHSAGVDQYDFSGTPKCGKPSEQLSLVMNYHMGKISKKDFEALAKTMLPKQMASLAYDKSGRAFIDQVKTADFFVPGSGEGSTTVAGTGVVPILVVDTIMEGAYPYVCAREAVWNIQMKSEMQTVPFFTSKVYLPAVQAGSDTYDLMETVGHATLKAKRHTVKASIGKELIKDAQMDIVSAILKEMGMTQEITMNQETFSNMLQNDWTTEETMTGTAPHANEAQSVFQAMAIVDTNGFRADTVVAWPFYWAGIWSTLVPAYNVLAEAKSDVKAKINYGGLDFFKTGVVPDTAITAKVVTYPTSGSFGALVFDKMRAGALGIREDMVAEQFDDVIKYLSVPVLTSRYNFVSPIDENSSGINNKGAVCGIKHT